jgi:hypothetical protein
VRQLHGDLENACRKYNKHCTTDSLIGLYTSSVVFVDILGLLGVSPCASLSVERKRTIELPDSQYEPFGFSKAPLLAAMVANDDDWMPIHGVSVVSTKGLQKTERQQPAKATRLFLPRKQKENGVKRRLAIDTVRTIMIESGDCTSKLWGILKKNCI